MLQLQLSNCQAGPCLLFISFLPFVSFSFFSFPFSLPSSCLSSFPLSRPPSLFFPSSLSSTFPSFLSTSLFFPSLLSFYFFFPGKQDSRLHPGWPETLYVTQAAKELAQSLKFQYFRHKLLHLIGNCFIYLLFLFMCAWVGSVFWTSAHE